MGSVKEVEIIKAAAGSAEGIGTFSFSDRYSVFDWGEMPDHIEHKGSALCTLSSYFFNLLSKKGIKSHFIGLIGPDGKEMDYEEAKVPADKMKVKVVRVIKPMYVKEKNIYDYSGYAGIKNNFLVPLEVIYRNSLPEGSSVFKRLKNGSTTFRELGLDHEPKPGEKLHTPLLDVSTKLEHTDRYISWSEAGDISGLNEDMIKKVKSLILEINAIITEDCIKTGIENVDGKFEFGIDSNGDIMVVDVLGTPDECRFVFDGFHISKEIARRHYRNTAWAQEVEKAKKESGNNWKSLVKTAPDPLPEKMRSLISMMYQAVTNELTGKKFFNVPGLKNIISELKNYDK
jgi:phosphoribosylaminoimidazole-succinocarboxamide synthase